MTVPLTVPDTTVAFVLFFFSVTFFTLGLLALGKSQPETKLLLIK